MHFLTTIVSLALSISIIAASAFAGPQDLAPISDEIVQKLVRDPIARANNPMPEYFPRAWTKPWK